MIIKNFYKNFLKLSQIRYNSILQKSRLVHPYNNYFNSIPLYSFCNKLKSNNNNNNNEINMTSNENNPSNQLNKFSHIAEFLKKLSNTTSRNLIITELYAFLIPYFLANDLNMIINSLKILTCQIEPSLKGVELNIADNTIMSIIAGAFKIDIENLKQQYKKHGDLATIVADYFDKHIDNSTKKEPIDPLTLDYLINELQSITLVTGPGSKARKEEAIIHLFNKITNKTEIFFLIRLLQKNLRIGMSKKSVVKALGDISLKYDIKQYLEAIEDQVLGFSTGLIGDSNSKNQRVRIGVPINCMLSKAASSSQEIKKIFKKFSPDIIAEIKYDGERSQIHYDSASGYLNIFSRSLESQEDKYSNYMEKLKNYMQEQKIQSCILDCEIVAFDYSLQAVCPFQELQTMSRKNAEPTTSGPDLIAFFLFDVLYLNGQNMMSISQSNRKNALNQYFKPKSIIKLAEGKQFNMESSTFLDDLEAFFVKAINAGFEGLILKTMDPYSFYDTNGKTQWIKLKKNIEGKTIADTLDLIPIAAYWGKGKRTGTFGAYLLAAYNPKTKKYEAICKIGTGFSDETLQILTTQMEPSVLNDKPENYIVSKTLKPDVWLMPLHVWEIESDKLTLSPVYTIGRYMIDPTKGLSLRFPRLKRIRDDKRVDQATPINDV